MIMPIKTKNKNNDKGFTLIELLVVAAIIGILLALAIPNLLKAKISANEAHARKMLQTLRDAEGEYFEQDLNDAGGRDFTELIGSNGQPRSLRQPGTSFTENDALIDSGFEIGSNGAGIAGTSGSGSANCTGPKGGYCVTADFAGLTPNGASGYDDFGWEASPTSINKTGRRDFSVYGDGVTRCSATIGSTGDVGSFTSTRTDAGCT